MNTQSVPIVAVVNGQRLIIDGNADGHIYALQARTGAKVWQFQLSKRGINVSPVIDGTTVFVAHSEENIDEGTMGRVVAIGRHRQRRYHRHRRAMAHQRAGGRLLVADDQGRPTLCD